MPLPRVGRYQFEDGDKIEPEWYVSVVTVLLFGIAESIGTGMLKISLLAI